MRSGIRSRASLSFMSISSPRVEVKFDKIALDSNETKNMYCDAWDNHYWLIIEYIYSVIIKSSDIAGDYFMLCQNYQELSFNEELYFCYLDHNKIMTKIIGLIAKKKPIIEYYGQWTDIIIEISALYKQRYENLQQQQLVSLLKNYNLDLLNEIYNMINDNGAITHDQKLNTYITIKTIADYINSTF